MQDKRIMVTKATREYLKKMFDCTDTFVGLALAYRRSSSKALAIRMAAVMNGGKIVKGIDIDCETRFDADGKMWQTFKNGVSLIVDLNNNKGVVQRDNEVLKIYSKMTLENINSAQRYAAKQA